jgi:hypothetical protein
MYANTPPKRGRARARARSTKAHYSYSAAGFDLRTKAFVCFPTLLLCLVRSRNVRAQHPALRRSNGCRRHAPSPELAARYVPAYNAATRGGGTGTAHSRNGCSAMPLSPFPYVRDARSRRDRRRPAAMPRCRRSRRPHGSTAAQARDGRAEWGAGVLVPPPPRGQR